MADAPATTEAGPERERAEYARTLVYAAVLGVPVAFAAVLFQTAIHDVIHLVWEVVPDWFGVPGPTRLADEKREACDRSSLRSRRELGRSARPVGLLPIAKPSDSGGILLCPASWRRGAVPDAVRNGAHGVSSCAKPFSSSVLDLACEAKSIMPELMASSQSLCSFI